MIRKLNKMKASHNYAVVTFSQWDGDVTNKQVKKECGFDLHDPAHRETMTRTVNKYSARQFLVEIEYITL